jgi:hypothetical protein
MSAMKSSKTLFRETRLNTRQEAASRIARLLLDESSVVDVIVCEASVHRGKRSRIWVASFTGPAGGQVWRSTGVVSRAKALLLAKRFEAQARAQRSAAGLPTSRPMLRNKETGKGGETLSQREIAIFLGISERAVRLVERRAFKKLFNHPSLRQVWRQYLAGELEEGEWNLTTDEVRALFKLARTAREWLLLKKVLRIVQA